MSKRKELIIFGCDFDQVLFVKRIEKPKRTCQASEDTVFALCIDCAY